MAKTLDVVIWGASGITGKRVCKQFAQRYQGVVKWAIAGRNRQKLTSLREELAQEFDNCKDIPLIVADVADKASVDAMTRQAEVVLACAGPFRHYSDAVVESCVRLGTHFLDVTGEVAWVRSVIDRFDEQARQKDVKVVNCCGLDSVPADIGSFFLVDYAKKRYGRHITRVLGCYSLQSKASQPFSGGTLASGISEIQEGSDQPDQMADIYRLNDASSKMEKNGLPDQSGPRFDKDFGLWTSPFLMQIVNKRVVHRSASLQASLYGPSFSYAECEGRSSYWSALLSSLLFQSSILLLAVAPIRNLLLALGAMSSPGEGPSEEDEAQSSWKLSLYGLVESSDASESPGKPLVIQSAISDNFGIYTSTARVAAECVMCLIQDKDKLVWQSLPKGGVLTPASAFGHVLIDRLNAIGVKLEPCQDGSSR